MPHGIFNKTEQTAKCFFWVSPTRTALRSVLGDPFDEGAEPAGGGRAGRQARGDVPAAAGGVISSYPSPSRGGWPAEPLAKAGRVGFIPLSREPSRPHPEERTFRARVSKDEAAHPSRRIA